MVEVLAALGLFWVGYKIRQDTSKEVTLEEVYDEKVKKKDIELQQTKVALEEKEKHILDLRVQLTRRQLIGIGLLASISVVAYIAYKARQRQKAAEERAEQILSMDNAWQCVVCEDNEKTVVYLPCNHLAVCKKCDAEMSQMNLEHIDQTESCPICRSQIMKRVNVHVQ